MKNLLSLCILLLPVLTAYAKESDRRTYGHIKGGITSYSSGFWGPAQERRNRFFNDNKVAVPGRPNPLQFGVQAGVAHDLPSGLSLLGGLEAGAGFDSDTENIPGGVRITDLAGNLLVQFPTASYNATTSLLTAGLHVGAGYSFHLSRRRRNVLKPYFLLGLGQAWYREKWTITEGFLSFSGGRRQNVTLKDQTLYKSFGLGLEWSPHPRVLLSFMYGWRYMNFDDVKISASFSGDPVADRSTYLKGRYLDLRVGAQF